MKYGFIGGGRMGSVIIRGFIERRLVSAKDITVSDSSDGRLAELKRLGVFTTKDNKVVASKADPIFLCVKPQQMEGVLGEIDDACSSKLVVSIAAGITTAFIEKKLKDARVIRVMPNAPALVGELAGGFCLGSKATKKDGEFVGRLLSGLGTAVQVDEKLMGAVTGLSGSGPAYVYYIIDALACAGVKEGLPKEKALALSAKTVKGAAEMVLATGKTPQELIDMVCSPGGTTIEGMKVIRSSDLKKILEEAVSKATQKSRKLSK